MSEMLTQHEAESIILHHYGQAKQEIQAVQELSELTLLPAAREDQRGEDYKEHLTEEMADVIVMIEQIAAAVADIVRDILETVDLSIKTEPPRAIIRRLGCRPNTKAAIAIRCNARNGCRHK